MGWLIGIDGGGTKTLAVLCDMTGLVHKRALGEGSSLTSVPRDEVVRRLSCILDELLSDLGGRQIVTGSCFGGFSGGSRGWKKEFLQEQLQKLLPAMIVKCCGDHINALTAGVGRGDGIVAIAGTGSIVYVRAGDVSHTVGGWGHLLSDEGSGYDMGRRALVAALRAFDRRGRDTILTALCEEKLGESIDKAVPRINSEGRAFIASFAPLLLKAQERADPVACVQAEEVAKALAELIQVGAECLPVPLKKVVLSGSVWQPDGFLAKRVKELLGDNFILFFSALPPVYGSVVEAAALRGITADSAFTARFQQSWYEGEKK